MLHYLILFLVVGCLQSEMSHFFWQSALQPAQQQQSVMPNEAVHEGNGWSSIGLAGDTGQGRQQSPNQNTSVRLIC